MPSLMGIWLSDTDLTHNDRNDDDVLNPLQNSLGLVWDTSIDPNQHVLRWIGV